jgi:WD40 repeat protein
MDPKPGSKPYRTTLRLRLEALGFNENQIVQRVSADLIQTCGYRPRQAWRLANELSLDQVARRYNVALDDPKAPMRQGRIWEFEQWPAKGARPTIESLKILAGIYGTAWPQLVDLADLARMPVGERDAYHAIVSREPPVTMSSGRAQLDADELASLMIFAPALEASMIDRPSDFEMLITMLKDAADPNAVSRVVAVAGPGGFGKTTLVTQACHNTQITEIFSDILWVETGEHCTSARVVQLISDLCVHLDGTKPALSDAEQAGFHFGRILADRKVLLVIDNVWSATDLMPFALGGPNTVRLITTRNARVAPSRAVVFRLGPMSAAEVRELLGRSVPELRLEDAARLAELCNGWPLLASVVSSTVIQDVTAGATPQRAVADAGSALDQFGPHAFDIWDSDQRKNAIGHAIISSLRSLEEHVEIPGTSDLRDRYLSLAIFPAATPIPLSVLSTWWGTAFGWTPTAVRQFCRLLADRSLIDAYLADRDAVLLHDVFRIYLRYLIGDAWPDMHRSLIASYWAIAGASWLQLDLEHGYMWRHLSHHLHEARQDDELARTLASGEYVVKKAIEFGYESLNADRTIIDRESRPGSPLWSTARTLTGNGYLLHGLTSSSDMAATLLSSLIRQEADRSTVEELRRLIGGRGFDIRWSMTDPAASGHIGAVTAIAANESVLASGGEDGIVRIWDLRLRTLTYQQRGHTGWIYAVAISPNGKVIASAGDDGTIRLWNLATGEPTGVIIGHKRRIRSLVFTADGRLVSGAEDGLIRLWDMENASLIRTMLSPPTSIWAVAVGVADSLIATAGEDEFLRLYDMASGHLVEERVAHRDWIRTLAFAEDILVSGAGDSTLAVWRVSDSRLHPLRRIEAPSRVRSVQLSAQTNLILSAGEDAAISAFSNEGLVGRVAAPATVDWIRTIALLPGGQVAAGCEDGSIRIWTDGEFLPLSEGANTTWSAAFTSGTALLGRADGDIEIRDLRTGDLSRTVSAGNGRVWDLRSNPTTSIAACGDGIVRLYSPEDDWTLRLNEQERRTWAVAINKDGTRAAASSTGGWVRVWELRSGRQLIEFNAHEGRIRSMAFNAAGDVLVTGGGEGIARVWRIPVGERLAEMARTGSWVRTVAIDEAGSRVALGCGPGDIYVHKLGAAEPAAQLFGHSGRVLMIGFTESPDVLVSAAADGTVRSWSISTQKQLSQIRADASLQCAAFSADDEMIIAGSAAGALAMKLPSQTN